MIENEGQRPWGYYQVLSEAEDHKVKRIVVNPGKRLSLQRHKSRSEHWYVVKGEGIVTLDAGDIRVKEGESIDIQKNAIHRMFNDTKETLVFIEVQRGDYFGEDDIERLEDDFGRS